MSSTVVAAMPGLINELRVKPGDKVEKGDVILVMESMKMHIPVESENAGIIESIHVDEGNEVSEGGPLVTLSI